MNPVLLAPLGLAALAALIVPLLIHLRRRTEQVPTDFAALRWLDPRPRPRQRIRFDEWPLLVTRLLLVALLALLLAQPALFGVKDDAPRVLVAPGVEPAPYQREGTEVRWLAPGFPVTDTTAPTGPVPLASLIRQFDAELPPRAPLTIVVPAVIDGADADRLRLTRRVRWEVVPGAMASAKPAAAAAPTLAVRHLPNRDGGASYLRAATGAWGAGARFDSAASEALPSPDHLLVWLRPGPVPEAVADWIDTGGTALLGADATFAMPGSTLALWRDAGGASLIEGSALGKGRVLRFTRALTPQAMPELLEPEFAADLRKAITPTPPPPARVYASDYTPAAGVAPFPQPPLPLGAWLAVLIAAVLLIERWLATIPRRNLAP